VANNSSSSYVHHRLNRYGEDGPIIVTRKENRP
jgi:hypothetical protein